MNYKIFDLWYQVQIIPLVFLRTWLCQDAMELIPVNDSVTRISLSPQSFHVQDTNSFSLFDIIEYSKPKNNQIEFINQKWFGSIYQTDCVKLNLIVYVDTYRFLCKSTCKILLRYKSGSFTILLCLLRVLSLHQPSI